MQRFSAPTMPSLDSGFRQSVSYTHLDVYKRQDQDSGIILLLDERFRDGRYQETFPREWSQYGWCDSGNVTGMIETFWDGMDKA